MPIRTKGEGKTTNTPWGWAAKRLPPASKTEEPQTGIYKGPGRAPNQQPRWLWSLPVPGTGPSTRPNGRRFRAQLRLFPTGCSPSSRQVSRSPGFLFSTGEPMTCRERGGDGCFPASRGPLFNKQSDSARVSHTVHLVETTGLPLSPTHLRFYRHPTQGPLSSLAVPRQPHQLCPARPTSS